MTASHSLSGLSVVGLGKKVISILIANEYFFFKNLLFLASSGLLHRYLQKQITEDLARCRLRFLDAERNSGNISISLLINKTALATFRGLGFWQEQLFFFTIRYLILKILLYATESKIYLCTYSELRGSTFLWYIDGCNFTYLKSPTWKRQGYWLPLGRICSVISC